MIPLNTNPFGVPKTPTWLPTAEPLRQQERPANTELIQNTLQKNKTPQLPTAVQPQAVPDTTTMLTHSPMFNGLAQSALGGKLGSFLNPHKVSGPRHSESADWYEVDAENEEEAPIKRPTIKRVPSSLPERENPFMQSLNLFS